MNERAYCFAGSHGCYTDCKGCDCRCHRAGAAIDAKTLATAFDQVRQALDAWKREPGFVKVLLGYREAEAMLAFFEAHRK